MVVPQACLEHGNFMNKKLLRDIIIHIFPLISITSDYQDAWNPIYLISFGGNGSNVMPSPKDSACSGWNDPVEKIGTWHIKKRKEKRTIYHMNEKMFGLFTPWTGSQVDHI